MTVVPDAVLSDDEVYRYQLTRVWDEAPKWVRFVMLNPSRADATVDDPTITRCIGFARAWGFGALVVHNLFALRATDPRALRTHPAPVGSDNVRFLLGTDSKVPPVELTVCAWGAHPRAVARGTMVTGLLAERSELACLGLTARGAPKHPLYLPAATPLQPYPERCA